MEPTGGSGDHRGEVKVRGKSNQNRTPQRAFALVGGAIAAVLLLVLAAVLAWPLRSPVAPPEDQAYEVVAIHPHDFRAFTQGLVYADGEFFESTGRRGASTLRRVHVDSGVVLQKHRLADEHFGEGLALVGDRLVQLTWTSGVGFAHDSATFAPLAEFTYEGEGWGLAADGERLVMSDGTAELRFLDPVTFAETRRVTVTDADGPVTRLNELEFVEGELWANVWQTDRIARIDPATGRVRGYLDLTGLLDHWAWAGLWPLHTDVLNGIAYDGDTERLFVTGKLWPVLFELRLR